MTRRPSIPISLAALVALVVLAACGGGSPTAPSSPEGIVLHGTLSGGASAQSGASTAAVVTVTVREDPAISATVGADGSFTLRGLPEGAFTLVFTNERGTTIGTLRFRDVQPNQEITITVRLTATSVTLVDEHRNGIGHGDVEIEGKVTAVVVLSLKDDSTFMIAGYTVVARPGQTAIRRGNSRRTVSDVVVGQKVHVKGVWLPVLTGSQQRQQVLAHEIVLQGGTTNPGGGNGGGGGGQSQCVAPGGHAEIEGIITAKGGSDITVAQQGKGNFLCLVDGGTRIRKGNTTYTFGDLQTGWRVHVKGTGLGTTGGTCQVDADEVKVQQN